MKSMSRSRKGVEVDPMRTSGSGSRDCHSGDCWLTKNVRDGRLGRGSDAAGSRCVVVERVGSAAGSRGVSSGFFQENEGLE